MLRMLNLSCAGAATAHRLYAMVTRFFEMSRIVGIMCLLLGAVILKGEDVTADRVLRINAPATVKAGSPLSITVEASTDGLGNEKIGFLQIEASYDGGARWTALCYVNDMGQETTQIVRPDTSKGPSIIIRARAAYRGGLSGDVDYRGAAIRWDDTWKNWAEPPAKYATITVRRS